jgi:hypothetical protein
MVFSAPTKPKLTTPLSSLTDPLPSNKIAYKAISVLSFYSLVSTTLYCPFSNY